MDNATHLGLDVHKDTIAVAILRPGEQDPDERVIPNTPEAVRTLVRLSHSAGRLVACYEAVPTSYDTYRLLRPTVRDPHRRRDPPQTSCHLSSRGPWSRRIRSGVLGHVKE